MFGYCPVYVPAALRTGAVVGTFLPCMLLRYFNRTIEIRLEPCSEQYGGVVELTVLLALTMQHFLAAPHFRSAFLFHSVSSATEECMLTPDKIIARGGG